MRLSGGAQCCVVTRREAGRYPSGRADPLLKDSVYQCTGIKTYSNIFGSGLRMVELQRVKEETGVQGAGLTDVLPLLTPPLSCTPITQYVASVSVSVGVHFHYLEHSLHVQCRRKFKRGAGKRGMLVVTWMNAIPMQPGIVSLPR